MSCGCRNTEPQEESDASVYAVVKEYYGKTLSCTADLQSSACCDSSSTSMPSYLREVLARVPNEVKDKYYGCGTVIPLGITGLSILDLGCGSGRDIFMLAKLVGEDGRVYGLDMTTEQLDVARKYAEEYCQATLGYSHCNLELVEGYMETMLTLPAFRKCQMDVVVSNCVLNLSPRKDLVLENVFNMLKDGGEFYFSDVFVDRRLPEAVRTNPLLIGECIGGALYVNDFIDLCRSTGFMDPRQIASSPFEVDNDEMSELVGNARFVSITWRLWKLPKLELRCEDYGQIATYNGTMPYSAARYNLDSSHCFEAGRPERVCGNTASMLEDTYLSKYFTVSGNTDTHYGEFTQCGTMAQEPSSVPSSRPCCG